MKAMMFAVLTACLVITTGPVAAEDSDDAAGSTPAAGMPASGTPAAGMPASPKAITVDAVAQARFGVTLATLKGAAAPTDAASTARVLDPSGLLQLDSELAAAAASFAASRTEAQRLRKLYSEDRTASARAVEAASAQAEADLQRVNEIGRASCRERV